MARYGYPPEREVQTRIGAVAVRRHGLLVTQDRTGKGLQTAIKRPKKMAQARRNKPPRRGQSKRDIYRRDQANPTRRLITLSPTFGQLAFVSPDPLTAAPGSSHSSPRILSQQILSQ